MCVSGFRYRICFQLYIVSLLKPTPKNLSSPLPPPPPMLLPVLSLLLLLLLLLLFLLLLFLLPAALSYKNPP